jgi:hypothetical protein
MTRIFLALVKGRVVQTPLHKKQKNRACAKTKKKRIKEFNKAYCF